MFGKSGNDDGERDDTTTQPQQVKVPPLRTFIVTRYVPSSGEGDTESISIEAHEVGTNNEGNILRFTVYTNEPGVGPVAFIRRCFNGWIDYIEVMVPRSRLSLN